MVEERIVWDNHICFFEPNGSHLSQLKRCKDAGIDVAAVNVSDGPNASSGRAIATLTSIQRWLAQFPDDYALVGTSSQIVEAKRAGKMGIFFNIEGALALDGQLEFIKLYYDLGVRWMLMAYNHANATGGGCLDACDKGLTEFGRRVIAEMNRVGMIVCASHCGYQTARDMIECSRHPVIFSHSNARALWPVERNIPDDLIAACASRGGVIGLNGIGLFLGPNDASIDRFVAHVEHVLALVGEDHIGIGLDFMIGFDDLDHTLEMFKRRHPDLFRHVDRREKFAMIEPWNLDGVRLALAARGHSEIMLAKLFGANWMRIARTVWGS